MSDAKARIEIEATSSRLPAALRAALGKIRSFGEEVGKVGAGVVKSTALGFIHGIGMSVANRGLDLLIDQGKKVIDFQRALTRFGIAARISGADLQAVGASIRDVSSQTGVGADEVLRGARAYVDLAGATNYTDVKMRTIARTAQAAGADIGDVAAVVYALQHNLDIKDSELEDTLGGLINMSKDGAVHFAQMGQEFVALSPTFAQFGTKGREGAIKLAAQLQLARTGFGSASEAATGLQRIYRALPQHAKLFDAAGVEIFKPGSRKDLLTLDKIMENIHNSRLEQDRPAIIKAFGRGEAERAYQLLDGLNEEYRKLEESGRVNGTVQQDLATYTESAAGRMDVAWERVKNSFAEALTPERIDQIVGGIEQIAGAMPKIVEAIGTVMDAFSGMIKLFQNTHDWRTGIRGYHDPNAGETPAARARYFDSMSDADKERYAQKSKAYEQIIGELIDRENATGPSQGSIEGAVSIMMKKAVTPGQEGARAAAETYLKDREVAPYIIERARQQIEKKENAEKSRIAAELMAKQIGKALDTYVSGALAKFSKITSFGSPVVSIDGNKAGSALDGASRHGRR